RIIVVALDTGIEYRSEESAPAVIMQTLSGGVLVTAISTPVELRPGGMIHLAAGFSFSAIALDPTHLQITTFGGTPGPDSDDES
ncbi:MAG TPA: hypothetical protein VFQ54_12725, partial [Thermomicrobiales bacterium]|nr:hypothetical protein [Thermomicrobiales bacterium]